MDPKCETFVTDIISFKRPTALDKLADTIPKPKGAIPNFGLPKWKVMPLESKIPMVPGPEGAYNFTRRKIGKRLWISAPDTEFNLSDPYGYEMQWTYDSLHDKHLVPHFSKPNVIRHLIKTGFITKNLDAKCSLRDYNMYRRYLRRLYCDSIKKELNRRTKWSIEERAMQYAQKQAEKEVKRLKEREQLMELRRSALQQRKMEEKLKFEKQKEKQQKIEERLQALILKKKQSQQMRQIKSKERAEMIQKKQKAAADSQRNKIIHTLLEWNRKERKRKRIMEIRLAREKEKKQNMVEQKWEERQEFQKKQIEKEQLLLKCIEDQRKEFIESYHEKVNRETERMKKLFNDMKMYVRCYLARHVPGNKVRICCRKYLHSDEEDDSYLESDKDKKEKEVSKPYSPSASTKQDRDKDKKKMATSLKKRSKTKSITKTRKKGKVQSKVKRKKIYTTKKAGKKKKKQKKTKKVKKETESETKFEVEPLPESIVSSKTGTSEASSTSTPDRCRCQTIKDAKKKVI